MNREKLPIRKLFNLKPGDKYVVYWAKDDNPRDVRLDHEVQTVEEVTETSVFPTDHGYIWDLGKAPDLDDNELDTGRGYAYFYRLPGGGLCSAEVENHG